MRRAVSQLRQALDGVEFGAVKRDKDKLAIHTQHLNGSAQPPQVRCAVRSDRCGSQRTAICRWSHPATVMGVEDAFALGGTDCHYSAVMSSHSIDGESHPTPPSFSIAHTGYRAGDVQRLLDDLAEAAERGEQLAPIVQGRELGQISFGYDKAEVEAHLARLTGAERHGSDSSATPLASPAPREASQETAQPQLKEPHWDRILSELSTARFRMASRSTGGYEVGSVDDVLDQLESRAQTRTQITDLIAGVRFPTAPRGVAGYEVGDVDVFLDRLTALGSGHDVADVGGPDDAGNGVFRPTGPVVLMIALALIALIALIVFLLL